MTDARPLLLLLGSRGHGVTAYGADVARAVALRSGVDTSLHARDVEHAVQVAREHPRTHVHVTDRLLGPSPEEAADNLELLASVTRLSITLHDLPQESDGTGLRRRVAAYTRMLAAADAVAVNSEHERALIREHLAVDVDVASIPLGTRTDAVPARGDGEAGTRDLVVLIAGYVYPGKGHLAACQAAAEAAGLLREGGHDVADAVVRAIGAPSPGHERDVDELRTTAASRGVRVDITGFLPDDVFASQMRLPGIPLAAHEHISASRSMLDWIEQGRRPLVAESRYAAEMDALRPGTMARYEPAELAHAIARAWSRPEETWLAVGTGLRPSIADAAARYERWWREGEAG